MRKTKPKKKVVKKKKAVSADDIAEMAMSGEDVSVYFSGKGKMVPGIQRVNVDFTKPMLNELDQAATELNVSRQAVIKTLIRQGLDRHYLAIKSGPEGSR